jgi:hypothetical protein
MLKMYADGERDGKPVHLVVIGLSHRNLAALKDGRPIPIDGAEVGVPGVEVLIFSGETEQAMAREMQELIGPATKVHIDPRLRD